MPRSFSRKLIAGTWSMNSEESVLTCREGPNRAPRIWSGRVPPACASSERISFRQINRKTGNRLRQQLIDEETHEPVQQFERGAVERAERLLLNPVGDHPPQQ
jgi:hypothetical protein